MTKPRPTPPALVRQLLARMQGWRDRINADGRRAAWVEAYEERGCWRLEIVIFSKASRPAAIQGNGAQTPAEGE